MRRTRSILLPGLLLLAACGDDPPPPPKPAPPPPAPAPVQGVAPARVAAVLAPMNRGLALIERYDYGGAATEFAKAVALEPAFYPAQFNLAVALVNNQKDPAVSEKALRAAAALAPGEAAPHFMLGMLLTQGVSPPRTKEAAAAFRRASELAPGDADALFRLGLAAKEDGRGEEAEREFTRALELNPFLGAALYQRGLNRMQLDREEEGKEDLRRFKEMEQAKRVDAREISYGFMGPLGDCVRDLDRWLPPGEPPLRARVAWTEAPDAFADPADGGGTLALADLDGDGRSDLLLGGATPRWLRNEGGRFGPPRPFPGPPKQSGTPDRGPDLAVADFDGDGRLDVAVEAGGLVLGAAAENPEVRGHPMALVRGRLLAADLDADGDVDLVSGRVLLLNDGKARFTPTAAPLELPAEPWTPLLLLDADDDGFPDLAGRTSAVRNLRGGSFGGERPLPAGIVAVLPDLADGKVLALADFDADGTDEPVPAEGARAAVAGDLDGDGDLDLVAAKEGRLTLRRNDGDAAARMLHVRLTGVLHPNGRQFGWTNPKGLGVRAVAVAGRLRVARWMGLPVAVGGKPDPEVLSFGLGGAMVADLLSLRWTEGVIQAEPGLAIGNPAPIRIEQVQRKAASCPVVFAWDGEKFGYVADCMGGGGLGFLVAPGTYGPPDPTERVRIAPEQMRPRDGFYEVRLHEPLEEIVYADRLALTAVDHPADFEAFPDERFGGASLPPPGDRVYGHRESDAVLPARAVDHRGNDILDRLSRVDRTYADGFDLHRDLLGFTEADHWVDLDFAGRVPEPGPGERLVLFLDGWVEYGYSRTFYAAAGAGVVPLSPALEIFDGTGWREGLADVGYPAGTPRTMTVDVTGVVTAAAPRFRLRTNLEIYWDRARLAVDRGEGGLVRTSVLPAEAVLRFAGFPREVSPDGKHPKVNDYALMDASMPGFRAMAGEYTRFGDVRELVAAADDRYVIFRNGEEIALRFRVSDFPPLRPGWKRTFLLETEGWCKDMDYYTATPETVEPLPFRGMTAYPPPAGEIYPGDDGWRREWNTRIVK